MNRDMGLDSSEYVEMGSQVTSPHSSVISQNWHDSEMKKFHLNELRTRKQLIDCMMRQLEMDTRNAQASREFPRLPSPTPLAPQDISLYRGKQFHSDTGVEEQPRPIARGTEHRQQKLIPACPSYYRQILPGQNLPELPAPVSTHHPPLPILSDQESSDDEWVEDIEQCDRPAAVKMPPAAEIMEPAASTASQFINRYRQIIQRKTATQRHQCQSHTTNTTINLFAERVQCFS